MKGQQLQMGDDVLARFLAAGAEFALAVRRGDVTRETAASAFGGLLVAADVAPRAVADEAEIIKSRYAGDVQAAAIAGAMFKRSCPVCAGRGTIHRVVPGPIDIPCQECRRADYEAFMDAERAARKPGGSS